jgi:hypothetical protein
VVGAVGGIEQRFCAWGNLALAVQQQVTNFLSELGSSRLESANHRSAKLGQICLD